MAYEQTDVEVEISGILDRLGSEMQAASRRIRTAPYASIEPFLRDAKRVINQVTIAGDLIQQGNYNTALAMLRVVEVPEIDFTDADEDIEPHF